MTVLREAANILDISEYDALYHAYEHWYGKNAPTELINRAFSDYLKTQQPPHWARHYALNVIAGFDAEMKAKINIFQHFRLLLWVYKQQSSQDNHCLPA